MKLYIVISELSIDYEKSSGVRGVFLSKKRAINCLKSVVESELSSYPEWYEDFIQNWSEDSTYFEAFDDGRFAENSFNISVVEYQFNPFKHYGYNYKQFERCL